ncbi:MAG: hypothetical protein MUF01_13270 [Bryobacterales bacterium]|jgi:hypothetical protein|nr:hypothetical protein [Bryobacterales bacterium]
MWASLANYLGIYDPLVYAQLGPERRNLGSRAAYSLLDVGDHPSAEQVSMFEDICYKLRMTNGSYKLTFRNRFQDVNAALLDVLDERFARDGELLVEDRAVSNALTSVEWARDLFARHPRARMTASDLVLYLMEITLPDGLRFVAEPGGAVLQCIAPPWVLSVYHREAYRKPLHLLMSAYYRRRVAKLGVTQGWGQSDASRVGRVRNLSLVHPEARQLAQEDARFKVVAQSVFDRAPQAVDVVRTMNILNLKYFSRDQLLAGVTAVHASMKSGGVWVVGRTLEEDRRNHASILTREDSGWSLQTRVGDGSEIEDLALGWRAADGR